MEGSGKKQTLLNPEEAANLLGCSADRVVELARRGDLRASKHGRVWRYREEDLTAYRTETDSLKP